MSRTVIVLTGPPGSGKSTVSAALARSTTPGVHLHSDDFWAAIVAGAIAPYEPESAHQNDTVMGVVAGAAFGYALGGFTTVVDGVVGPWMLEHFRDTPPEVELHYVVLRPSLDRTLQRAQARTGVDALVDEGPLVTMWQQFADLGEYESHVIDTSDEAPTRTLGRVADAVRSGRFRI
ncbi:hypothetical protein TPB0596_21180 [Tsukamurella pulmonis]|uniref:AAA family ATPase n=1 Tax=Tsukamurella pulmonis TaxID=47312 RepID=UPI001EDF0705|nr:AAA family ATPase [Tsukamurella pulmonis]BDD82355.1 hypothetical protein TPB0596_21180 [Tsukamurella pulmonis]